MALVLWVEIIRQFAVQINRDLCMHQARSRIRPMRTSTAPRRPPACCWNASARATSAVIIPSLSAGAVKNLTAADIEAALGTQAETARPRLRITAPSNSLTVQNMLFTPNTSFTNNSAQQQ